MEVSIIVAIAAIVGFIIVRSSQRNRLNQSHNTK